MVICVSQVGAVTANDELIKQVRPRVMREFLMGMVCFLFSFLGSPAGPLLRVRDVLATI